MSKLYNILSNVITRIKSAETKVDELPQADWNQNDETALDYVKNKTHYDTRKIERVNYTFDGNIEGKETLTVSDDGTQYLVKISDDVPLSSDLIGGTMSAYSTGTEISGLVSKDVISYPIDTLYVVRETLFVALGDTDLDGITLTKGMWIIYALSDGVPVYYVTSLSYPKVVSGELKKLEEKYIPDATNEAISTAQSTANNKMNITNPVGTGSFSLNRKSGTIVGACSHAEGGKATASGAYSHAEGRETTVTSDSSVTAQTFINTTKGFAGHAEGIGTVSYGCASHAEGNGTTSSGNYSHAEGRNTTASGDCSHAEGDGTKSSGNQSHAEGYRTIAASDYQHVQGKCNIKDSTNTYAHIVGNGTGDNARSNAHTLDWNGVGWFQGGLQVGGNSQDGEGAKSVLLDGDAIPVPVAAKVGQLLSVKAVDDNGVPTEWEVVDLPDDIGSGNSYDAIIEGLDFNFVLAQGSFEDLKTKILAGEQVYVDAYSIGGDNRWFYPVLRILYDEEDDEIEITTMSYTGSMQKFGIESDNGVYVY